MNRKANNETDGDLMFSTGIGPITDKILNGALEKLSSSDFREKLSSKVVDPLIQAVNSKIQPYVYMGIGLYSIIIILLLFIIYLLVCRKKR